MNALVAVAIAPFGEGEELSEYVAEVIRVIRDSGLPSRTNSMFTEIEGEYDEVMRVVKDATFVLAERGIRTEIILKADIRGAYACSMPITRLSCVACSPSTRPCNRAESSPSPSRPHSPTSFRPVPCASTLPTQRKAALAGLPHAVPGGTFVLPSQAQEILLLDGT